MKTPALLLATLLAACAAGVRASDDPTTSMPGVADLTPDNFDGLVNGAKHALVEFYAPWCGHCKRMSGDYKKLGETVQGDALLKSRVVIAKVNADDHKDLAKRFGVGGYPTIKYFARGKPVTEPEDYKGGRTADAFLSFLKQKLDEDKSFGRVEAMDAIAAKWVAAGADKKALLAKAEEAAKSMAAELADSAGLYVKAMRKALDKGDVYFAQESGRLERMIASGSVAAAKVGELGKKLSVLGAFVDAEDEDDVDEE